MKFFELLLNAFVFGCNMMKDGFSFIKLVGNSKLDRHVLTAAFIIKSLFDIMPKSKTFSNDCNASKVH